MASKGKVDKKEKKDVKVKEKKEKSGEGGLYHTTPAVFGKWDTRDLEIKDPSLADYVSIQDKYTVFVPHTAGRYAKKRFRKVACPIIERLINSMMMHGRNSGKKMMAMRIVQQALEIIHLVSGANPMQILADAVQFGGPREDSTRIGSAGVVRRQAVDVSPMRRINQAIYLMSVGARNNAFRNLKSIAECLADELMNTAADSQNSYAIKKKGEIERVAQANR